MSLQLIGQALIAAGNVLAGGAAATQASPQPAAAAAMTAAAMTAAPAAAAPALSAAAQAATSETLLALIQPHLGNQAMKDAFGVAMRGMGIPNLPEVQPHQIPALYDAFEKVIASAPAAAAPVAII